MEGVINRKGRGIILISAQNIDKTLDTSETMYYEAVLFMSQSSDDYVVLQ